MPRDSLQNGRPTGPQLRALELQFCQPLEAILEHAGLALDTLVTTEQREHLEAVRSSAISLTTAALNVLTCARLDAGDLELAPVGFSIREVVAEILTPLTFTAEKQGLILRGQISEEIPERLRGDPRYVRLILSNLVTNALKFTTRGHINVDIERLAGRDEHVGLLIAVTDTGGGLSDDQQPVVLAGRGPGLGVRVVTGLATLMSGQVSLESRLGHGSTFRVALTFSAEPSNADRRSAHPSLSILVVGDNAVGRRTIVESLNRHPLAAKAVAGPARAIDELAEARRRGTPFSLILLDIDTTIDQARSLAEDIARGAGTPSTPILLLSSSGELKDLALWKELGLAAFLVKPVRQSDLVAIMAEVLGVEPPAALPDPRRTGSSPARRARVLLAESNLINQRVSLRLLASRGHSVTVVGTGGDVLAAVSNAVFDVVLIERQLPDLDALQVAAAIREHERSRAEQVRILAIASHVVTGDRERCLAAGIDGYLRKPLDRQELFDAIEYAEWSEEMATAAREPVLDRREALRRLRGDEELLAQVSRVFLERGPELLRSIKSAIDVGDAVGLQQWAHQIKASAEQFGAAGVVDAARALEILGRHRILEGAPDACQRLEAEITHLMTTLKDLAQPSPALS